MKKAQVVFIPFPGMSHLVSTLEFAKLLINRNNRLRITVLVMKFPHTTDTDVYTKSLPISDSLQVINLPECSLPPNTDRASAMTTLVESQKPHVKQAVSNLTAEEEQHGPLAAFIVDMFCTTMIDVAKEFSVPGLMFFTSGVASLGLILHLHTLLEQDNFDVTQLQQKNELAVPSFANMVPVNTLPSFILHKEWESFFKSYGGGLKKPDGIIVNSFEELESHAVQSFFSHTDLAALPIYPVGPLLNPEPKTKSSVDSDDIIKWLDDQPPSSVVFLCFGTRGSFYENQIQEIAHAIENSGVRFIWSLRKPSPKGTMPAPSDYPLSELVSLLPEGFLDCTTEIGKVVGWTSQAQILAHRAIGGFVSHCGWNSILESMYFGVPIAAWPLFAEQQTNAFELVCELKLGVEIALDYRVGFNGEHNYVVTAEKIERGIKSVLDKDGAVRKNVKEMSKKSKKTLLKDGSSYIYLGNLIDYIMNQV
ncbi:UDP-glucose flavonoid 3-O-glucosyltransferase 6-like [Vicia villosa]|uniref:UDP-glucose flavonoid 3-O-glucosyltransferase 6-like n=1 Tax=Vicia villosa TaxID=3911 RepID=UPI00273C4FA0|nr:UDP-glucose flavonoid 3-O-glucosyltransferase 6-like [Vicia villosa]